MKGPEASPSPLGALKNFQRRTVERAMQRLYLDADHGTRFLVADEVGLGKTMVARGLISEAIAHLQREGKVRRIDVVYICSNAAIARQNLNRLSVDREANFVQANRLTMLANSLHELSNDRPNFVSFTPGTSFELKSSGGRFEERLILYRLLSRKKLNLAPIGLRWMLRGGVTPQRWRDLIRKHGHDKTDAKLRKQFLSQLRADKALYRELRKIVTEFAEVRARASTELKQRRNVVVGRLRTVLARTCVHELEPDLVILDEFQRFKHLLDSSSEDEAVQLASLLMSQTDAASGEKARVVLLSATPYKLLTLDHEKGENHYDDFLQTLRFLFAEDTEQLPAVESGLRSFRRALLDGDVERAREASTDVSKRLRRVMSRTERVSVSQDRDAMLSESRMDAPLHVDDLLEAAVVDRISHAIGAPEPVEYWKSSPYLISTLKGYELKKRLERGHRLTDPKVREALVAAARYGLKRTDLERYAPIDPRNGRLRVLLQETVGRGQAGLLWIPPSLPYLRPRGPWQRSTAPTKSLVFSAWNVAPDCIAALCSYEAERAALVGAEGVSYFDLHDQRKPLLTFKTTGDQIAGTVHLSLLYPSPTLAMAIDPLRVALEEGHGEAADPEAVRRRVGETIAQLLRATGRWPTSGTERIDQRWYWAAPALLDAAGHPEVRQWCASRNGWRLAGIAADSDEDRGSGFESALARFLGLENDGALGRAPEDLVEVLTEIALAGPGVVALRSLLRIVGEPSVPASTERAPIDSALLQAAATMAEGMRSLFNHPEAIGLLSSGDYGDIPYWRRTLRAGIDGNLQATFDEYLHTLKESLGLFDRSAAESATQMATVVREAASIRSSRIVLDEIDPSQPPAKMFHPMNVRSRFALRFGQMKDDKEKTVARIGTVREAFNSPFRPFVLATTSIGQEGLDFHTYCHSIYHWNLPSNPVDLEQREGRIQRYKGHAVRRNVALRFGLAGLGNGAFDGGDPWQHLFELAAGESAAADSTQLRPYWIYEVEGGAKIERRVPVLPFSREVAQLARLKRELTLYRLAFGQPRQEDLLQLLDGARTAPEELARLQINLRP